MALGISRSVALPGEVIKRPASPLKTVYDSAATTQAQDYDDIMKNYDDLLNSTKNRSNSNSQLNFTPINPVFNRQIQGETYNRSKELGTALSGLEDYSRTGGYSDNDINNIRERGISPIRSIYDSANRGIQRQKVLSGGYAPNLGAVTSKLSREASGQIGDITSRVNADIAQMVASGKLAGLQSLGSVAGRDNELSNATNTRNVNMANQVELANAEEQRRVDEINQQMQLAYGNYNRQGQEQNDNTQLNAIQGKTSLYGTTPALTNTFANQVLANNAQNMQAVTTANQIKNQRANIGLNLVQSQLGRPVAGRG